MKEKCPRDCAACGKEFMPSRSNKGYCSDECKREGRLASARKYTCHRRRARLSSKKCPVCGKEFEGDSRRKYCCPECSYKGMVEGARQYRARIATVAESIKPAAPRKQLDDWVREARECNLDYGNYRALIAQGKTFDELKATASSRQVKCHSHIAAGRKNT